MIPIHMLPYDRWPAYDLTVRRKADGVTATTRGHFIDDDNARFMCSDGNYGCDCNRHLFFERGLGHTAECGSHPCGDKVYEYVSVTSVDGGRVVHKDVP